MPVERRRQSGPPRQTLDPHLRRVYCPKRQKYLHFSGQGFVDQTHYAWSGNIGKAHTLARHNPDMNGCILLPLNFAHTPSEASQ